MIETTRTLWLVGLLPLGMVLAGAVQAQTTVTFWHSMQGGEAALTELVRSFNESQHDYRVEARYVGSYPEAQTRLVAAFGTADEPTLFQAEISFFPLLVRDGAVHDLAALVAALPQEFVDDFYTGLWSYGELAGGRYGLPWNSSTPVMYYNVNAFERVGLDVPTSWSAFAEAARALTTRQAQGAMFVGDSWLFEMMVLTMGGTLVGSDGQPDFESPEALAALTLLHDLSRERHLAYFGSTEATAASLNFVRSRSLLTFASIANWPDVRRFSIGFRVAAAPVPMAPGGRVPLGGAQLVVMRNASEAERDGAFAFWRHLMEPESVAIWVRDSYYIPVRRAALPLLGDFYAEDPNRAAALSQLDLAVPRPRLPEFTAYRRLIDEALDRALRGNVSPEAALADLQRRALEVR
jgi:sn-glycerol 3-phosphate transport system substrate-binding protein